MSSSPHVMCRAVFTVVGGVIEFPTPHRLDLFANCPASETPPRVAKANSTTFTTPVTTSPPTIMHASTPPGPGAVPVTPVSQHDRGMPGPLQRTSPTHVRTVPGGDARGAYTAAIYSRNDGEWTDMEQAAKSSFTAAGPQKERVRKAEEYADAPPTLPPGCFYDDGTVSKSMYCSNAGLTAVPQPLPSSLEYM
jgi:hypothetical protein